MLQKLLITISALFFIGSLCCPSDISAQSAWNRKQLEDDLDFLARELPKKHKNLYANITEKEFLAEIEKLKKDIPKILSSDDKVPSKWQLGLMSVLAKLKDGHTNLKLDFSDFQFIPVNFKHLADGVFIRAISQEQSQHFGSQVVQIGQLSMDEVIKRLQDLIPHDNIYGLHQAIDFQLNTYDYLTFIGAADAGQAVELKLRKDGKDSTVRFSPYSLSEAQNIRWKTGQQGPRFGMRDRLDFWNDYLKEDKILYFKYNRCRNQEAFKKLVDGTAGFVKQNAVEKFVIDMRNNGGGNSTVFRPLLEYLVANDDLNQKSKLFVIVGRQTYSSAILNTLELKAKTNVTIVGEPTSGKPNHFGEVRSFQLPNTGTTIRYSTKYFRRISDGDPATIEPDLLVPLSSSDWFSGKNAALDAIRKQ